MRDPADPIVVGIVSSPHGLSGTVKVKAVGFGRHLREGIVPFVGGHRRRILSTRRTGKGHLVDFEGIEDRVQAVSISGMELLLDRGELDEPDEGEFYVEDLIGLRAEDDDGNTIGEIEDLLQNAGNELMAIRPSESDVFYVPFTVEHVPTVDLAGGRVVVRPPEE